MYYTVNEPFKDTIIAPRDLQKMIKCCRMKFWMVRFSSMSQAEIIAELPKLSFDERQKILECLCDLQDRDLIADKRSNSLKKLLDQELEEYERDGDEARPWREVMAELLSKKPK